MLDLPDRLAAVERAAGILRSTADPALERIAAELGSLLVGEQAWQLAQRDKIIRDAATNNQAAQLLCAICNWPILHEEWSAETMALPIIRLACDENGLRT